MNEFDIQETFDFELILAKLLLKSDKWICKSKGLYFNKTNKSYVYGDGKIFIGIQKYVNSRDYIALRHEIRGFFANLHSGFAKQDKFRWQRSAKKLGLITKIDANDYTECELCTTLTPLTTTKRCLTCRKVEAVVKLAPEIARKVLDSLIP